MQSNLVLSQKPASMLRGTMTINASNHLEIGGVDVVKLMEKSQYPIYILDEKCLRDTMQSYVQALRKYYKNPGDVFYASKAFMTLAMCKIVEQEGLGLDVSTEGELYTALKAGFPMQKVILHGNNKSEQEIEMALRHGVGRVVVDNLDDIKLLDKWSQKLDKDIKVLIRVKPGLDAHTHSHIATGNKTSKFGFIMDNGEALGAISQILEHPRLQFEGIHIHIGSQILEIEDYIKAIDLTINFIKTLDPKKIVMKEMDLGGGLGVVYTEKDKKIAIEDFVKTISAHLQAHFEALNLPLPRLMLEPGRSIVAEAGTTLYTMGSTKTANHGQIYAAINGGMSDNIRPALYQSRYYAVIANKMHDARTTSCKIVGKTCESGDVLIDEIMLPTPVRGDTLAVFSTGAYNYSMASHYNRLPIPGVLLVHEGQAEWIVKPEDIDAILAHDVVPQRLQ